MGKNKGGSSKQSAVAAVSQEYGTPEELSEIRVRFNGQVSWKFH
jgi:hypothetical protein